MVSPYKARLREFKHVDNVMSIHRKGGLPVFRGKIIDADDFGCEIAGRADGSKLDEIMFVAYEDIGGVSREDNISHVR